MVASGKFLWPKFPLQRPYKRNGRVFKFKNKAMYVDFPNPKILEIYQEIMEKCDGISDRVLALNCAEEIINEANGEVDGEFLRWSTDSGKDLKPFFRLHLQNNVSGKKPFLFGYSFNKEKFIYFLKEFSESNKISLEEKYKYITGCKFSGENFSVGTTFSFRPSNRTLDNSTMKEFRRDFGVLCQPLISSINEILEGLLVFLRKSLAKGRKTYHNSIVVSFIPDLIVEIDEIRVLVQEGFISSCYREIRSLTERLSYVVLDDYLTINTFSLWEKYPQENPLPYMLLNINPSWRNENTESLRKLDEIIPFEIKHQLKKKEMEKLRKELLKKMSIEMYVTLTGIPSHKNDETNSPFIDRESINTGIKEIKDTLESVNPKLNEPFTKIIEERWNGHMYGIPRFPTSNFIFHFLKSVFGSKMKSIESIWNKYSLFIHPYSFTWQVFQNTSILEYQVFLKEVQDIENVITTEIGSILKYSEYRKKSDHNS
jgi:hypothetical protein